MSGCCNPGGQAAPGAVLSAPWTGEPGETDRDMPLIPEGVFRMGCDRGEGPPADGEGPSRDVFLPAFRMDRCAVTNQRFAAFVAATGHRTQAERQGWSYVFAGLLPDDFEDTRGVAAAPWWREVMRADWRHPEGPGSSLEDGAQLPVVHVSHDDALAFCAWAGKRLPTEAEWEKAARGGRVGQRFGWGDEETVDGFHHCNVWQGRFPSDNTRADGHYGLASVGSYPPNDFGLHDMAGNSWEWCADWFDSRWHRDQARLGVMQKPAGPPEGTHRVLRGGSYLCHPSYCWRYRNAARSASTADSSTGHIGFRCVRDVAIHQ